MSSELLRDIFAVLAVMMVGAAGGLLAHVYSVRKKRPIRLGTDLAVMILGTGTMGVGSAVFNLKHSDAPLTSATWVAIAGLVITGIGMGRMLWHLLRGER
jgi:hypothetical protein